MKKMKSMGMKKGKLKIKGDAHNKDAKKKHGGKGRI